MEYVVIDFQTANELRSSACEVALVTVKDGKIVDTYSTLIRPDINYFDEKNIALHGITKDIVKDQPYFDELWPLIKSKINGKTLVAHYAPFDTEVLADTLDKYDNLQYPACPVFCTCVLAQQMFPELPHHRLNDVCEHIGYKIKKNYNALEHAKACVAIINEAIKESGADTMQDLADYYNMHLGYIGKGIVSKCDTNKRRHSAEKVVVSAPSIKENKYNDMPLAKYAQYWIAAMAFIAISMFMPKSLSEPVGSIGAIILIVVSYLRFKGTKHPFLYGVGNYFLAGALGFTSLGRKE